MARRLCAAAASFALHLLVVAAVARLTADPRRAGRPAPPPSSMAVFVVPPAADPALPGLKALETTGDDQIRRGEGSSTVSIPGFTFDIRKIGERATLLFPFLTPGLSLEHFAIAPRREVSDGYRNPFAPASPATPQAGPRRAIGARSREVKAAPSFRTGRPTRRCPPAFIWAHHPHVGG